MCLKYGWFFVWDLTYRILIENVTKSFSWIEFEFESNQHKFMASSMYELLCDFSEQSEINGVAITVGPRF